MYMAHEIMKSAIIHVRSVNSPGNNATTKYHAKITNTHNRMTPSR
jgi:hypothetical protein